MEICLVTTVAVSIDIITLLITAIDNGIARRPQIAMQRAFGVSLARVRRTQVLQALLPLAVGMPLAGGAGLLAGQAYTRSEEHTSELQSRGHLVCRLLLEKKKQINLHAEDM